MLRKMLYFWDCFWSDYHVRRINFDNLGGCPHERKWCKHEFREGDYNAQRTDSFGGADRCREDSE